MIVIPMAGLSSRFYKAGYKLPKYMLEAHGEYLFDHAVKSFSRYFKTEEFLFIVRNIDDTSSFVESRLNALGVKNYQICSLDKETKGQAETVALGLQSLEYNGPITIFNIDTFRPGFCYPSLKSMGSGYLEVFKGEGDNWSFAKVSNEEPTLVTETSEKKPISNLCCTGLYYFASADDFRAAYEDYSSMPKKLWAKGELYVAPLYNLLIDKGLKIHVHIIDRSEVIFCGVPEEYEAYRL